MPNIEIKSRKGLETIPLDGATLTIGRGADNAVVLADRVASRKHCVIEREDGGGFVLRDLGSHNGTWMGENRVIEAALSFGDVIRIGSTILSFVPDELDKAAAAAAPTAEIVTEEAEELPPSKPDKSVVATTLAARAMAAGPLSKQLGPLMQACATVPRPDGAPDAAKEVRMMTRKGKEVAPEKVGKDARGDAIEGLRQLMFVAFRIRATDIHIEPRPDTYMLRLRIDGQMHNLGQMTAKMGISLLNVIKILCDLDIAKRNVVQEGSFSIELPARRVDFRVNLTPSVHGQKLALRFLDKGTVPDHFEALGMTETAVIELNRLCGQDAGMIILAGPTGSGKTTTLYTALKSIDAETRNIVTIEDPVEYELEHTTQISIDPRHNLTFASILTSILRQDPDVILVGEVRDEETAKTAMQAATTGHLVLTTLHARDTVGTIFRLLDLGVEGFLIASAVTMCISQRLVRRLCPACKQAYKPDAAQIRRMRIEGRSYGDLYDAVGCKKCMGMGYRGRLALFEILMFTPQLRDVILTQPTISDIRKAAGEWMFETLQECGYRRVLEGETTFSEVERVSGMA